MRKEKFNRLFDFAKKSKIKAGEGREEGLYPFYTSSPVLSKRIDRWQIDEKALVFGTGGKPSIHFAEEKFSTSTDCIIAVKKGNENFNIKYVYYYLFGNIHILERGFKGAGLKHISKKYIKGIEIHLPDLQTQNKIVAVLDKASALLQKREQSLQLLDELLRAQFLEMFGDPVLNPKGWEKKPISTYCKIITGNTPPRSEKSNYDENYMEWIKTNNILEEAIYPSQAEEYLSELGSRKGRIVDKCSVLMACIAGSLSSIGRVALCNRVVAINQQINAIVAKRKYNPIFLYFLLKYSRKYIQSFASKGMKKIITKGELRKIEFIVPPGADQNAFSELFKKLGKLRGSIEEGRLEVEKLFNSLLQRAFNGQLNFDEDTALNTLLAAIDLEKEENDLRDISFVYLRRLLERLNEQAFEDMEQYQKAKHAALQLIKEGKVMQQYEGDKARIKLEMT
ncbi:MAG: restriction endonuclease subunit S [Lewinellaceae bacterium]|nr:restriction endonuclease subunit S [Lewinellaceae bacterium]